MTKYIIRHKAGEWHVWTTTGYWVAWFRTEAEANAYTEGK